MVQGVTIRYMAGALATDMYIRRQAAANVIPLRELTHTPGIPRVFRRPNSTFSPSDTDRTGQQYNLLRDQQPR